MGKLRTIRVQRTARYALEGDPDADIEEAWFVLHGYAQRAEEFLAEFEGIADPKRLLIAPEGLSRFYRKSSHGEVGASWMTSEDREAEIIDYTEYLDALHRELGLAERSRVRVRLLGFSQGVATAYRWAVLGAARIDHLIAWAGGVPPDLDLSVVGERLATRALTLVLGERDRMIPADRVDEELERLDVAGIPYRSLRFAGGHRMDDATLAEIARSS